MFLCLLLSYSLTVFSLFLSVTYCTETQTVIYCCYYSLIHTVSVSLLLTVSLCLSTIVFIMMKPGKLYKLRKGYNIQKRISEANNGKPEVTAYRIPEDNLLFLFIGEDENYVPRGSNGTRNGGAYLKKLLFLMPDSCVWSALVDWKWNRSLTDDDGLVLRDFSIDSIFEEIKQDLSLS